MCVCVCVCACVCVCVCVSMHHQAVNPIELGNVALAEVLRRFYADFPAHPEEKKYNYVVSSSMKPTQVREGTQTHVCVLVCM